MARDRVTRKHLEKLTSQLNNRLGRSISPFAVGHIRLDYASCYNGYALREVDNALGGLAFYWPRWLRVPAREMDAYLQGQLDMCSLLETR